MFSNIGPFVLVWETLGVFVAGVLRLASGAASVDHLTTAAALTAIPALYATWELDRRILERAGRSVSPGEDSVAVRQKAVGNAPRQQRIA